MPSVLSVEPLRVKYRATRSGVVVDPTADVVAFATTVGTAELTGTPTWVTGAWETYVASNGFAVCYISSAALAALSSPGTYGLWVKVTDTPYTPVVFAGYVVVK